MRAQDLTDAQLNDAAELDEFPTATERMEQRAIVLHAGGAVRFSIPPDWHVHEFGIGRQVRLLVSPHAFDASARDVFDGFWLALEYYPHGLPNEPDGLLQERVASSLQSILGGIPVSAEMRMLKLSAGVAAKLDFQMETRKLGKKTATDVPANLQEDGGNFSRGFHMVIQTDWCRCHIHAIAPAELAQQRFVEVGRILGDLRLIRPSAKPQAAIPAVRDAESVLGSWKAYAGRIRLGGDGTIEITTDAPFGYTSEDGREQGAGSKLAGRFRARDDLLFIEWQDESKLNYRWRLSGDRLLMTDHEGRTTQLNRISE